MIKLSYRAKHRNVRSSHAKVTKNRAITIFDSPEEGKRGWSELGLRIRKPNKSRGNESQASYDGHFMFVADEVILSIFQKMPKPDTCKMCKSVQAVEAYSCHLYDESLWRRLDFGGRILKGGVLGNTILDRGVEFLRLASAEIGDFTLGKKCFTQFHKLQYLDLTMASISQNALSQLLSRCKQLRKLSIENLAINDDICRLIAQNVFLTTLNCAMVSGLTCKGLEKIFNSCPLLDELNIGWIKLSHSDVGLVISKLPPNLIRLNFSGCREFMDDHNLDRLVSCCNQLRELDVSDSLGLTEQSVYSIVRELKYLNTLHLSRCYYISPSSYSVLRELPHFKALSVYSMLPEEHLSKIRRNLISASVNSELFSTISRPTVGMFRTSIWGHRVRDFAV
ncbi:Skp2 [Bugula neritina]|uniref:Skp2 n=1 Tax=Bugula neritina TaxID=10212 RepID=A0A7J7J101_BUGNE|nr:Skp2 [Bugula neritina]